MNKWKRLLIVGVILSLAMMLPFPSIAAADEVTVSIDAPAEVGEGTDFIARVNITEVINFDACNYDITYDPTLLRFFLRILSRCEVYQKYLNAATYFFSTNSGGFYWK